MATRIRILTPNGKAFYTHYTELTDKREIAERLLKRWGSYCEAHWFSDDSDKPHSTERKVKAFLDSLAYLLLRDNPEDTLSLYKEYSRGSREIPVSSCPAVVGNLYYGDNVVACEENPMRNLGFQHMLEDLDEQAGKHGATLVVPKPKKQCESTRSTRLETIRAQYPGCSFSFHRVDTENHFDHNGTWYHIADHVEAYRPKETREGLLYDMDQVVVVEAGDHQLHFYDQQFHPIDRDDIEYA